MASLQQIISWFQTGLFPTADQFRQTWLSYWHKSEKIPQSQIFGLQETIEAATRGLIYQNPVTNVADLYTTYPNAKVGWAAMVTSEGYIYSYNGTDWANTGLKEFPEDVATKEDLNQLADGLSVLKIDHTHLTPSTGVPAYDDNYPYKISEFVSLLVNDSFNISLILPRTDLAYMAIYDKNKLSIKTFIYESGMETTNIVVKAKDLLATYPNAVYIRFCSNNTTAIVNSYIDESYGLNMKFGNMDLQLSTYPFIFNIKPDYYKKYWSAGGVLSDHQNYICKEIDVVSFAGKRLRLRQGYGSSQQTYTQYSFIKKGDGSYITLNSCVKGFDSVSKILDVVLPTDAVALEISIDTITLDLQPFVCYDSVYNYLQETPLVKVADNSLEIANITYPILKKENGYLLWTTGLKPNTTDTSWTGNAGYIGVKEGTIITYSSLIAPNNVAIIAAYDLNKNYLQANSIQGTSTAQSGIYTVPSVVAFVRMVSSASSQPNIVFTPNQAVTIEGSESLFVLNNIVASNVDRINAIEQNLKDDVYPALYSDIYQRTTETLQRTTVNYGYQNANGVISGLGIDKNWFNTDFLKVKLDTDIIVTRLGGQGTAVMTVGFFDENHICLKDISITEVINDTRTITVNDERVKYVRFSGTYGNYANGIAIVDMYYYIGTKSAIEISKENTAAIEQNTADIAELRDEIEGLMPVGYKYDINHYVHYGQSLSQGDWETKIVSYAQKYNSLMFTGTMRVWEYRDQANRYNALIPAIEDVFRYRYEVDTLNITSGATANGNLVITLAGTDFPVAVLSTDNTPELVAAKIRSTAFAGWVKTGTGSTVIFTKQALGVCPTPVFNNGGTGVSGNIVVTVAGENQVGATVRGETPCVGTGEKFMKDIQESGFDFNQYQFHVLLSAPGMGGTSIETLANKNGIYYKRLLEDVTNGKRLANADGKTYACHAVSWIQGEANCSLGTSFDSYYTQMENLFNSLNTDIKAITGQTEDVHFYLYQTWCYDWYYQGFHYPYVPLAQLAISLNKKNVHMVSPIYQFPLISDYTHFTAEGSKWYGGYCGLVYKKVLIDGEDWKPIHLTDYWLQGNNIYLKFYAPAYPLVFDTVNVKDRGISKGFQIREPNDTEQNSFLDIINNVEIVRPDTIKITCSESPLGKKLTYAINGTATPSNRADMGSGNLRDSSTDTFSFPIIENGQDVEHKLYNWCPLFEQIL